MSTSTIYANHLWQKQPDKIRFLLFFENSFYNLVLNLDFHKYDFEFGSGMVWCYFGKTKSSYKTSENTDISNESL